MTSDDSSFRKFGKNIFLNFGNIIERNDIDFKQPDGLRNHQFNDNLEKELKQLEQEKTDLSEKLSSPSVAFDELQKCSQRIAEISNLIDEKELRWLELSELAS